jgi:hypothetical protein
MHLHVIDPQWELAVVPMKDALHLAPCATPPAEDDVDGKNELLETLAQAAAARVLGVQTAIDPSDMQGFLEEGTEVCKVCTDMF